MNEEYMHPIILPKKSKLTELIVKWCRLKIAHRGRGITLNEIRDRGFWIINASSITKSVVFNCVTCRKLRGKMGVQIIGTGFKKQHPSHIVQLTCLDHSR